MAIQQPDSRKKEQESKESGVRILVVDDHPLLRHSIRSFLETQSDFEVVGEGCNGLEAIKLVSELHPDVVIIDIGMPGMNGLEATRKIKAENPRILILVLTVHTDEEWVLEIMRAGASGYLIKDVFGDQLVEAVRGILAGEIVLSPPVADRLVNKSGSYTKLSETESRRRLTNRDITLVRLAALGMSNKEIAVKMDLSLSTIKAYFKNIYEKLEVNSRTQAVTLALREGLISINETK